MENQAQGVERAPVVQEWIDQGKQQGVTHLQTNLLKFLPRLGAPVPEALTKQIEENSSLEQLSQWFAYALESSSLEEFQAKLTQ